MVTSPTIDGEEDEQAATPIASHQTARHHRHHFHPWRRAASDFDQDVTTNSPGHERQRPAWLAKSRQEQSSAPASSASAHHTDASSASSWTGMLKGMIRGHSDDGSAQSSPTGHSRHTSREYKETLDAHTQDEKVSTTSIQSASEAQQLTLPTSTQDGTRIINQYHLVKVIGHGTYGVVYKGCLRDDPSQLFAVKEFSKTRLKKSSKHERFRRPPNRARGTGLRGRGLGQTPVSASAKDSQTPQPAPTDGGETDPLRLIRREIAIMKKLDHPNLICLLEALDDPSRDELYMVLEFCSDGPVIDVKLHERTQPIEEPVARSYFVQILLGIEYLHHNDIIHRDIKPDNVLLCDDRQTCKIVDFGVSEMFDQATTGTRLKGQGTPAFLSPELCSAARPKAGDDSGDADAVREQRESSGRRDDMWALGVTLYCIVVGHLPFDKSHFLELYDAIKGEEPEYPSHLSVDCVDLLKRFLDKDPQKRLTDVDEIRRHPWVTDGGRTTVLSAVENLKNAIHDITEAEIQSAIVGISTVWTVARAVSKFKLAKARGSMRSASNASQSSDLGHGSADSGHGNGNNAPLASLLYDASTPRDSPVQSPRLTTSPQATRANTTSTGLGTLSNDYGSLSLDKGDDSSSSTRPTAGPRSQPLSRSASQVVPESISESPEGTDKETEDQVEEPPTVLEHTRQTVAGVYDKVAGLAQAVVPDLSSSGRQSGTESSLQEYSKSLSANLVDTLRSIEKSFEARMRHSDPTAAKKHLANAVQQYPPLERLKEGLKGMGLNLFGWSDYPDGEAQEADEHSGQDQTHDPHDASQPNSRTSQAHPTGVLDPSRMQEDESGKNVHTGRRGEEGTGSSGVRKDRQASEQNESTSSSESTARLFDGPLIVSPRRDEEFVTRAKAAETLRGYVGGEADEEEDRKRDSASSSRAVRTGDESYGGNLPEDQKHEQIEDGSMDGGKSKGPGAKSEKGSAGAGEKQSAAK